MRSDGVNVLPFLLAFAVLHFPQGDYALLFLSGAIVTTNLNPVGGVLAFSLLINAAAEAYQLTYSLRKMFILSGCFGVLACFLGLFFRISSMSLPGQ